MAHGDSGQAAVVGVADAGILADHGAGTDGDAGHGDKMHAARDDDAIADDDGCGRLRLQMQIRIEERIFPELNCAGTVDDGPAEHDHGGGQREGEVRGQRGVGVQAPQRLARLGCRPEQRAEGSDKERFGVRRHRDSATTAWVERWYLRGCLPRLDASIESEYDCYGHALVAGDLC